MRADADLAHAVENLVDGAYFNSGQCCCGIERIYVHERRLRQVRRRASSTLTRQYVLGDPLEQATTLGPMAQQRAGARSVREQIAEAVAEGRQARMIDAQAFRRRRAAARPIWRRRC